MTNCKCSGSAPETIAQGICIAGGESMTNCKFSGSALETIATGICIAGGESMTNCKLSGSDGRLDTSYATEE